MSNRFVAVDIGNSTIHAALYEREGEQCRQVSSTSETTLEIQSSSSLSAWISQLDSACQWWTVCVNKARLEQLREWLASNRPVDSIEQLDFNDSPVPIHVDAPQQLGMDRLAAGVAANRLRRDGAAAIVVDSGTAITVDVVDPNGGFRGGAILPGVQMSARALDERTDALPRIIPVDQPPPSIGTNTVAAIHSRLFWGSFGAVKELIRQHRDQIGDADVFVTGGAVVWAALLPDAFLVPNLTLQGVAEMASHIRQRSAEKQSSTPR